MKKPLKNLILIAFISIAAIGILLPTPVNAEPETKTVQVPITKNYKSAKFSIIFEYFDDYNVVLMSPKKNEYKCNLISENTVESIVEDVEPGQWSVTVSKKEKPPMPAPQPSIDPAIPLADPETGLPIDPALSENPEIVPPIDEETDEYIEEEEVDRPISPFKVQVEGSTEQLMDVTKDIAVSTDIAGLKMYFKDDSFIAEWTDTTCGNVNIEVENAKNLQVIDKQTVQGMSYECPLSPDVNEIMVKIVPSVSSNIEGAESTYSFVFDNNPNAIITFEDLVITNHDTIIASCDLKEPYALQVLVNGQQMQQTDKLDAGMHEIEVPIEVGSNDIKIYVIDDKGNMRSTSYTVEKDVVAPKLELVSSYEDIVTEDEYLTIEGKVEDYDKLMINNAEIDVEGDNTFKFDYKLKEGLNQIAVVASDIAGNETVYDIAAERIIPVEEPIPWVKIIIIASLVGIFAIYIFEVIRRKNNHERYQKKERRIEEEYTEYDDIDISTMSKKEKNELIRAPGLLWDVLSFVVPIAAAYIILTFVIFVSVVQSGSMLPTLKVGNTVFYNRLAYIRSAPERGDVVVFYSDEFGKYFGKRIIGMPGDKISFKDGYVMINGRYCDETAYIPQNMETNCTKEFVVPDGCFFMLGDNRTNSNDSRYWDEPYIHYTKIYGKYMGQIDFSIQYDILGAGKK